MLAHLVQSYYHHFVSSSSLDYCKLYRVGKICLSLLGILLKQWYPFKLFLCGTLCGCSNFQLVCSALFYTNFMLLLVYMFNRNNDDIYTLFFLFDFYSSAAFQKKDHYVQNHVWHPVCYQREYSSPVCGRLCFVGIFHWWTLSGIHRKSQHGEMFFKLIIYSETIKQSE